jgi:hypothetical protein
MGIVYQRSSVWLLKKYMAFCLPKEFASKFIKALKDGTIDPKKLTGMTSAERREFFKPIVGEEDAKEVNAMLEQKLLLKDQKRGLVSWAKKVSGINEFQRADIVSKINKMSNVLDAPSKEAFLNDLANKKVGTDVTYEEAKKITATSNDVQTAKNDLAKDPMNKAKQIAYGNKVLDLSEYVDSLKPKGSIFTWQNIANIPKSTLTSVLHFSAMGVQGWGMMGTAEFYKAAYEQFKYFGDPKAYRDLQASIIGHPDYKYAIDGKLSLTKLGDKLTTREEAIQSSILEHIPLVKVLVKASSRSFTGFLNYVRFNRFASLLDSARLRGEDVTIGSRVNTDIAKTVNDFTGRGNLGSGDKYGSVAPGLNAFFFSPRKISATMEMFDPVRYLDPKISPTARMGALRQLSGSLIATAGILSLARLAGASVDLNPTSSNFAKMKVGNTTIDPTGGNSTYIRLLARIISGKSISQSGKVTTLNSGAFGGQTKADDALGFFRGKLSPIAATIADVYFYGQTATGEKVTVPYEVQDKLSPVVISDFINLVRSDPKDALTWLPELGAVFGLEVQTQAKK